MTASRRTDRSGKANLLGLGMALLLLICGAALLVHYRISLGGVQVQRSYLLFGTQVDLTIRARSQGRGERVLEACFHEMKRVQSLMNVYSEHSELSRLNARADEGWANAHGEIFNLIQRSLEISEASEGAFDITVSPLLKLWRKARKQEIPPSEDAVKAAMNRVGYTRLELDPQSRRIRFLREGMSVDLGGIAKGYALDRAKQVLLREGIEQALLNAGGDVLTVGSKGGLPWKIGIQDPRNPQELIEVLRVSDEAVVTSGDYERFFMYEGTRYHHILDPRNGYPSRGCMSVTVVGPNAAQADVLATAVFVMGPGKGLALLEEIPSMEGLIIDDSGVKRATSGLQGKAE